MLEDFVRSLRAQIQPNGVTTAAEVLNGFGARVQNPGYLATVAFPYGLLNRAGLLDPAISHPR